MSTETTKKLFRPFGEILLRRRGQVIGVLLLILITAGLESVSLSLVVPLMRVLTGGNGAGRDSVPSLFQTYDLWLARYSANERLGILGVGLMVLFGLKNSLQYLREALATHLWMGIGVELRTKILAGTLNRPYRYFLERKHGTLVQHMYHEPQHVAYALQIGIEQASNVITVAALFGLLLLVSWPVTVLVLMGGALYGWAILGLSRRAQAGGEERQRVEAEAVALLTEAVAGVRQVKIFSAEHRIQEVYDDWVRRFRDVRCRQWLAAFLPHRITEMFWIGVVGILLCLPAIGMFTDFKIILPVVAVFSAVAFRAGPYVSRVSQGWMTLRFFLPSLRVVGELLEDQEETRVPIGRRPFRTFSEAIEFHDVSFSYSYSHSRPALSRISMSFNRGETTAILGPSGAGKSTLVDLLARLYEPSGGCITVDRIDLRDYDLVSWREAIGFVSQDTFIFHGTIRDNIAFSRPQASTAEIILAARQANAHEFIECSAHGYRTVVGDRGLKLSGGERQRIAIARALLRDPEILIFDEATSALDRESEALIHESLTRIARDRTVILIAHRFSLAMRVDKIVVLDNGKVMEQGPHSTLAALGGAYSSLYTREHPH